MNSEHRTKTFASLSVHNFRLYFIGQGLSLCGTWMQTVSLSVLVFHLTHSGTQLGMVLAAQFLPVLLLGVFGGSIADRYNKRNLLYVTQIMQCLLALSLGLLVLSNLVQLWMVYVIAAGLGLAKVVDVPSRQTFITEMVGHDLLKNAITLNSMMQNGARIIGPSIAAILISASGIAACFLINAGSYIAMITALSLMRTNELLPAPPSKKERGQLLAGFSYAWQTPPVKSALLMMLIIGTFAYEFQVSLPLFAMRTLHGTGTTYSMMTAAMGIGAIGGGLYSAGRPHGGDRELALIAALFGISIILTSLAPNLTVALLMLIVVGALSLLFTSIGNTTIQLTSAPTMRGRVMSLWAVAFAGTTPIGGPIIGAIADHTNPRVGLFVGGVSALLAAALGMLLLKNVTKRAQDAQLVQSVGVSESEAK